PIPAKCRAVDDLARKFIRQFTDSVALESKWLGEAQVTAAIDALSRRVNEIASRSKQQILEAALTEQSGESPGPPQQQSHTVSGGWPMGKLERTFSASQQERLKNADERLRIALEAHEKMREIVDPGGWHPVAPQINAQTLVDEIRKLEDDLRKIAIDIFNVLAEAAWPLGSLEPFRTQLEVDAREILEWVLAKVNPKDLPSLDKTSLENAISRQVSNWIRKARQTFAPPWAAYTEAKAEPSLAEQQRYSSRDQIQSAVRDLFKEDTSARPLGDNPFPSDHPAHQAFEESTWEAKEAIGKLQSRLLVAYNTPAELLQSIFKFRTGYFNVVVKQAMCIVGDAESARWYESWVNDFARFYLDDTVSRIKCRDPNAAPQAPPYFDPESVAGFERDLTFELMRIVGHYKTEATSIVLRIKKEKSNASAKGPKRRGRRPNEDRRDAIRSAITKYGDEWRDHLGDIFNELDGKEVPLGDLQARKIDLGDGESTKVSKWDDLDLAQGEQRRQIIDVLRKYAH
ncbi:MAG TPA: hypothetical protein VGR71_18345, partial [Nitrospira sp.]|nr:hypothetical protein [Nitrospira sp.]